MSKASSAADAVHRLGCQDAELKQIHIWNQGETDANLVELTDCLLAHPSLVTDLVLGINELTDETGVKLARYLASSSTVEHLSVYYNKLGEATYLALAAALRVNSSLRYLNVYNNLEVDRRRVDAAFVNALWVNPMRPAESLWRLYSTSCNEFDRLKAAAEQLGHPSLQTLLVDRDLFRLSCE